MERELELIVSKSNEIKIVNQETLNQAGEYLKQIKEAKKVIDDYWDEEISRAYKTHKGLIAKKKELIKPYDEAEKDIKNKMSDYIISQEKAKEELESTTNEYGIEVNLPKNVDKIDGISYTDSYTIDKIDLKLLPKELNGVILIKPDESAIKKLIKLTKGKIEIPGVKFTHSKTIKATRKEVRK